MILFFNGNLFSATLTSADRWSVCGTGTWPTWARLVGLSLLLDDNARIARPELHDIINDQLHRLLVPLPQGVVHHLLPVVRPAVEAGLELLEEPPFLAQAPRACDGRRASERPSDVAVVVPRRVDERRAVGLAVIQPHLVLRGTHAQQGASTVWCREADRCVHVHVRTAA